MAPSARIGYLTDANIKQRDWDRVGVPTDRLSTEPRLPEGCPMPEIVIENPILKSPYREPTRHFRLDANNEITLARGNEP
jgi:hypothetical protein